MGDGAFCHYCRAVPCECNSTKSFTDTKELERRALLEVQLALERVKPDSDELTSIRPRLFPILGYKQRVYWSRVEPHARQAFINHDQTLEELARRGGLCPSEMLAVLEDRPWSKTDESVALLKIMHPRAYNQGPMEGL